MGPRQDIMESTESSNTFEPRARVDVRSPGRANLRDLQAVADGLSQPLVDVAARVCQAPSVLADGLDGKTALRLAGLLESVGLDVRITEDGTPLPETPLFDLAVQISEPARIEAVVGELSAFLGLPAARAYGLLALPPGAILGRVGSATVEALEGRLGPGVAVRRVPSEEGPFDLYAESGARLTPHLTGVAQKAGWPNPEGYIPLGASHQEAVKLWSHLKGRRDLRLVNRGLVRFEVVLTGSVPSTPERAAALTRLFGVPRVLASKVLGSSPLALAEDLTLEQAQTRVQEAEAAGIPTTWEAAGFGRAGVRVESAEDLKALATVLSSMGLQVPPRLPAQVAHDLPDLEARRLSSALSSVGASTRYTEPQAVEAAS